MNIVEAIAHMKADGKARRTIWGSDTYLVYRDEIALGKAAFDAFKASPGPIKRYAGQRMTTVYDVEMVRPTAVADKREGGEIEVDGELVEKRTPRQEPEDVFVQWQPAQDDVLADDWEIA